MVSDLFLPYHSVQYNLSLNPCSNGIWSLTVPPVVSLDFVEVLILVLMEYGL